MLSKYFPVAIFSLALLCAPARDVAQQQPPNGQAVPDQGPVLASYDHLTGAIRLHFAHAEDGLVLNYQPHMFQIAGADRRWCWADAHAFGDVVIVSTSLVQNPVAVRYDWNVGAPSILFNKAGAPARPFRTDDWPGPPNESCPN